MEAISTFFAKDGSNDQRIAMFPYKMDTLYLYYYSRLVTPAIFTHRTPTTMYGVSMEPLWPPDHNLIGGFGVPASWGLGGTKEFWREIQNF